MLCCAGRRQPWQLSWRSSKGGQGSSDAHDGTRGSLLGTASGHSRQRQHGDEDTLGLAMLGAVWEGKGRREHARVGLGCIRTTAVVVASLADQRLAGSSSIHGRTEPNLRMPWPSSRCNISLATLFHPAADAQLLCCQYMQPFCTHTHAQGLQAQQGSHVPGRNTTRLTQVRPQHFSGWYTSSQPEANIRLSILDHLSTFSCFVVSLVAIEEHMRPVKRAQTKWRRHD